MGGQGGNYISCCSAGTAGYNGGGTGGSCGYDGGGGGGSDIRVNGTALSNRVVVAGGGGGGGWNCSGSNQNPGGGGGGTTGQNGRECNSDNSVSSCYGGLGGTQSAGGAASTCGPSGAGTLGTGGVGYCEGGGGGGGYYGGSGCYYGGGGGGSSFTDPTLCSTVTHTQGYNTLGNGIVKVCPGPVTGTILGNLNICPATTTTLSNPTGSTPGTWSSTSSSVTVGATTGLITGYATGTATVTYSASNSCATGFTTAIVTVNPLPSPITGPLNVCVGSSITLSDPDGGGTWSSPSTSMVTVNSTSGLVTAISGGSPVIDYTLPTGCVRTGTISANPLPNVFNVTAPGGNSYCASAAGTAIGLNGSNPGINYQLYNGAATVGGTVSGTGAPVSFGIQPAGSYSVMATTAASGCSGRMAGTQVITLNALPPSNNVTATGGTNFCAGSVGVPVGLNGSASGINYQLYNGAIAVGSPVAGSGGAFSFGNMNAAGTYTVQATDATTFCQRAMTGSAALVADPLPLIYGLTGGGTYCAGGTGVSIGVANSEVGVNYRLYMGMSPVGSVVAGTGGAISFGTFTAAGNYNAVATNATTGCTSNMSGTISVSIAPLPSQYNVTGGGSYCSGGAGVHIGLNYSASTISYQLLRGSTPVGAAVIGVDNSLDFGTQTTSGTYTVLATNTATGCSSTMTGSAVISINSLPAAFTATVSPTGSYCAGGAGVHVKLTGSASGVSYSLMYGSSTVSTMAGSGAALDFGAQTNAGAYTVVATNGTTGCTNNMTGTANITINALPNQYLVNGGGDYCTGGGGVSIGLGNSDAGIRYQLLNSVGSVVATSTGAGGGFSFGTFFGAGAYTVLATDLASGCQQSMTGSTSVTIDPLPTAYAVTGGGNYCTGGTGVHVGLAFSNTGINYQLKQGVTNIGLPMSGSDGVLDFGSQTGAGNYTVVATNTATGCTSNMSGSATITVNSLPGTFSVNGGGSYCPGALGVPVGLGGTSTGVRYQLFNGSAMVGGAVAGTGAAISFGNQTAPGTYSVMATMIGSGCSNNMTGTVSVSMNTAPTVHTVTGGGSYCAGGIGEMVGIDSSDAGVDYTLYRGSTIVSTLPGTGSGFNFGTYTTAGGYTIKATDLTTTCSSNMSGSAIVTVLPLPIVYTVTGGGSYCAGGAGVHINLSGSTTGVNYQLMSATPGATMAGTNTALDFGAITAGGTYTVVATNAATGCTSNMASTATVTVNSSPNIDTVTGGGSYCAGGTGVVIGLNATDPGVSYQLIYSGTGVGLPMSGTGGAISFGSRTASGTYTIRGTAAGTGCTSDMYGNATVTIVPNAIPAITFAPSPSTNVCAGTAVGFTATATDGGAIPFYQWTVNGVPMGTDTSYFSYTPATSGEVVMVTMTSSAACATPATASTSATISVNPVVTPSVNVTLSTSNTICRGTPVLFSATPYYGGSGASYKWFKNGSLAGTGITYSDATLANSDNVVVRMFSDYACRTAGADSVNSSTQTMNVVIPAIPTATVTARPGNAVWIGHPDTLTATVSNAGASPMYQWDVNGHAIPGATTLTFVSSNFNDGDVVGFTVTNNSVCGVETGSKTMTVNVINNLGVNNLTANATFTVMPNPNKGTFLVKGSLADGSDEEITVEVTNMLGQTVYKDKTVAQHGNIEHRVQLGGVANGMYILSLKSGTANTVFHIVVEQ